MFRINFKLFVQNILQNQLVKKICEENLNLHQEIYQDPFSEIEAIISLLLM